jgi:hypothetical protein
MSDLDEFFEDDIDFDLDEEDTAPAKGKSSLNRTGSLGQFEVEDLFGTSTSKKQSKNQCIEEVVLELIDVAAADYKTIRFKYNSANKKFNSAEYHTFAQLTAKS